MEFSHKRHSSIARYCLGFNVEYISLHKWQVLCDKTKKYSSYVVRSKHFQLTRDCFRVRCRSLAMSSFPLKAQKVIVCGAFHNLTKKFLEGRQF